MFPRKLSGALLLAFLLEPAVIAAVPLPVDALRVCAEIAAEKDRLACYDRVAGPAAGSATSNDSIARPASAVEPEASPADPELSAPAAGSAKDFGAESVPKRAQAESAPRTLDAVVVRDVDGISRDALLPLDNGQLWRVLDEREFDFIASRPAVHIIRNPIGTFWMRFGERGPSVRVRRLR